MKKKKEISKNYLQKNIDIFMCPICKNKLSLKDNYLICENKHTFDLTKKGTLFLLNNSNYKASKIYNKKLFINRRAFINDNHYLKIYDKIINLINKHNFIYPINILDLGCGEGTHSMKILNLLHNSFNYIGIDYSKDAIELASDYNDINKIFLVSDTNNLPFKDNSIDLILNFLSPYNEKEVKRVLKDKGLFIKITPATNYLKELRNAIGILEYEKESEIENNIKKTFLKYTKENVKYTVIIKNKQELNNLIEMTPINDKKVL